VRPAQIGLASRAAMCHNPDFPAPSDPGSGRP